MPNLLKHRRYLKIIFDKKFVHILNLAFQAYVDYFLLGIAFRVDCSQY